MDENESQHYFEKNYDLNFKEYKPAEKKNNEMFRSTREIMEKP